MAQAANLAKLTKKTLVSRQDNSFYSGPNLYCANKPYPPDKHPAAQKKIQVRTKAPAAFFNKGATPVSLVIGHIGFSVRGY